MSSAPRWRLHPRGALRMAGFPFSVWEQLVPPGLAADADAVDRAWARVHTERDRLLHTGFPAAVRATGDPARRRVLSRMRSRVGRLRPVPDDRVPELGSGPADWNAALAAAGEASRVLGERYPEHLAGARSALLRVLRDERVREAVEQLSPGFARSLDRLPSEPGTDRRHRATEQRAVLFLQRLAAKNETNSFFGPVGAVLLDPGAPDGVRADGVPDRGPAHVFSSPRLSMRLAERIAGDPALACRVPLRRSPMFDVRDGRLVHLPSGRSAPLDADGHAAWRTLTGAGTGPLERRGALHRRVPVDPFTAEPLDSLRDWLTAQPPGPARDGWVRGVDELRDAVRALAAASGPARRRERDRIETRFTELTGVAPEQGAGRMYSDRTVVFEERENSLSLTVGGALADGLPDAVAPALTYWAAVAAQRRRERGRAAAELFDRTWPGACEVAFPAYLRVAGDARAAVADRPTPAERRVDELLDGRTAPVELDPAVLLDLAPEIDGPVFSSVDLLLTDPGPAADPCVVLGEAHAGHLLSVFPTDHFARLHDPPAPAERDEQLFAVLARSGRRPARVVSGRDTKIFQYPQPAVAVQLRPHLPEHRAVPASRLTVRREDGGVGLYDEHGPLTLVPAVRPAPDGAADPLAALSFPAVQNVGFGLGPVRPRVRVGRTVVQRASRRVAVPALAAVTGAERYLAARAFRRAHDLPEQVFVSLPWEAKPVLLDLSSPLSVDAFAGLLRHPDAAAPSARLLLSEMLPGPDDLWLAGRRTFELRMLAWWAG